jgi:phosphatidylserine/phosphatidylglycerophosphate/cardiolipin synthase-like enzyme
MKQEGVVTVLTTEARQRVQQVIDEHVHLLTAIPGFVAAEPGFPLIEGKFVMKPAIIVWVTHKMPPEHVLAEDRAPTALGGVPVHVMQADPVRQWRARAATQSHAGVGAVVATYTYKSLDGDPVDKPFTVTAPILCHVGPDAGWPALKGFLKGARTSLSVSIYDFNANYIATALIDSARANALDVTVNWDDSPRIDGEQNTFVDLRAKLDTHFHDAVVRTGNGHRFANSYHEKVAVRDSASFWLSSGNWTVRSQPDIDPVKAPDTGHGMYGKYNREWHLIVNDADLAELFETYIRYDFDQSEKEAQDEQHLAVAATAAFPDVFVPIEDVVDAAAIAAIVQPVAPKPLPASPRQVSVQPVLTPDNYVERVTALLKSAKRSVYLQFAYITYSDARADKAFTDMLEALKKCSNNKKIDTKIIVGATQAADNVGTLVKNGFNQEVFRQQTNIHNKGIVIDGQAVLVSSANWSSDGVLRNRDAGLIIYDRDVAAYYQNVFLDDWNNRAKAIRESTPAILAEPNAPTPPGMARISWQDFIGD